MKKQIDLSQPEHTPAGRILSEMWYGAFLENFSREEVSGCPNTGGRHTLYIKMNKEDFIAFLDLIKETYRENDFQGTVELIAFAKEKMHKAWPEQQPA